MGSQMTRKRRAAFTLAEMIVVLIILSVIAAVALPQYNATVEKFRAAEGEQILLAIFGAQKRFAMDNGGSYAGALSQLDIEFRPSSNFGSPAVSSTSPIAQITRTGSYTLQLSDTGAITCTGGASGLCARLGY